MTTKRKKKSAKKGSRKTKTRKKKAGASARKKSAPDAKAANGGFVILLDEPDPEGVPAHPADNAECLRLRSDCTIEEVKGIRQRLLNAYAKDQPMVVDLSAVEKVDTAFLQLLCSLARKAEEDGMALRFQAHSASTVEAATLLGLAGALHCE